jgi:hypothetical protein
MNIMAETAAMIVTIIVAAAIEKSGGIMETIEVAVVDMTGAVDTVTEAVTEVAIGGLPPADGPVKKETREALEKILAVLHITIPAAAAVVDAILRNQRVQKKLYH